MKNAVLQILILSLLIVAGCNSPEKEKSKNQLDAKYLLQQGKTFTEQTQKVLAKNLMNAITEKGTEYALSYCSLEAYPLTDSMAVVLNAKIKRVSDKNRNPRNIANKEELDYIVNAKELKVKGEKVEPGIIENEDNVICYYPIITNAMCLQCHGNPDTEISPETMAQIEKYYPDDKATGYGLDEIRGIWVVKMLKN